MHAAGAGAFSIASTYPRQLSKYPQPKAAKQHFTARHGKDISFFLYSSKFAFYIYFFSEGLVIELTVHKFHWSQAVTQSICSRFDTSTASKRYKSCSGYKLIDFIDFPQSCDNDISLLNLVEQTAFPICQCEHENQFTALFRRLSHQESKYSRRKQTTGTQRLAPAWCTIPSTLPFSDLQHTGLPDCAYWLQLSTAISPLDARY